MDTSTASRNVLIVEDNPDFAALMAKILELNGLKAATVGSGRAALAHLRDHPVDLLLLDFRLPDMDGFEVLSTLEEERHSTPFVVVTGLGDHQLAVELMKRGARDYLVKDESLLQMLPSVVGQILDRLDRDRRLAEAEQRLREQNAFFQTVLDALFHPLYVIDTATGRIEMANRAASDTGRTAFSLARGKGQSPLQDATVADSPVEEVARTGKPLIVDHVQYEGNETNVYEIHIYPVLDGSGEVRRVVEYELDITPRKQAQQALRDSEARLRQVVESLPIILLSADVVTRKMILLIGAVEDVLGYERRTFFDDPDLLVRMIDAEDFEHVRGQVIASVKAAAPFKVEFRIVHGASKEKVWVRAQCSPILDEDGTLLRLDGVLVDITAERQAAAEREAWSHRLQQAQRLESLGVLAGGIAHDFSNLLTIVSGNVQFLRESLDPGPAEAKAFADIESAVRGAIDMTRSLQAFGQPGQPKFVRADANTTIQEVYRFLRRLIPARIEFQFLPGPLPCPIAADPAQLQQVLISLCINSRDAIANQGRLEIRTRSIGKEQLPQRLRAEAADECYVEISVTDTGSGMDEATLRRVFDPFFTTKPKDQGTGLGLAIVYRVVQAHRGVVDVTSEPGRGTRVCIYLPRAEAEEAKTPASHPAVPRGTERVLVVDDEEMIASLIKTLLESVGYEVIVAHHPEEALLLAADMDSAVDLAIIDYGLPAMGGDKCLSELRKRWPRLKAMLITGYQVDAGELGLEDVRILEKPFSSQAIKGAVRETLDHPAAPPEAPAG